MKTWNVTYTAGRGLRKCHIQLPDSVVPTFPIVDKELARRMPGQETESIRWTPSPTR